MSDSLSNFFMATFSFTTLIFECAAIFFMALISNVATLFLLCMGYLLLQPFRYGVDIHALVSPFSFMALISLSSTSCIYWTSLVTAFTLDLPFFEQKIRGFDISAKHSRSYMFLLLPLPLWLWCPVVQLFIYSFDIPWYNLFSLMALMSFWCNLLTLWLQYLLLPPISCVALISRSNPTPLWICYPFIPLLQLVSLVIWMYPVITPFITGSSMLHPFLLSSVSLLQSFNPAFWIYLLAAPFPEAQIVFVAAMLLCDWSWDISGETSVVALIALLNPFCLWYHFLHGFPLWLLSLFSNISLSNPFNEVL